MVAEVIGSIATGSLALLADAAHMLTDVGGLGLALVAIRFAERPATPQKTFGYLRMEILSALLNAIVPLLLTIYILYEAYQRYLSPVEVAGGPMLVVAAVGLGVNLASMRLLKGGASASLNVQGAYYEVLGDMLGSLGVIVAAVVVMRTGWTLVDPLIGAGIGFLIVPRTWKLVRQAVHILMEGVPAAIDLPKLESSLKRIAGVVAVYDLHVWTITSGFDAMSAHVVVQDLNQGVTVLRAARRAMKEDFGIDHLTLQIEDDAFRAEEPVLQV